MKWSRINGIFGNAYKVLTALHVFVLPDEHVRADWVVINKSKGQVQIKTKDSFSGSLTDLYEKIPKEHPLLLSIDGRGILIKAWEHQHESSQVVFRELFPQARYPEFFVQMHASSAKNWLSVCRKESMDELLQALKKKGISLIDLKFGPFHLEFIRNLTNEDEDLWQLPNRNIIWEGSSIASIAADENYTDRYFRLGDEELSGAYLNSFAHGLAILANQQNLNQELPEIIAHREQYKFKLLIQKTGWGILGFFLVLLLINYLVFTSYNKQLNVAQALYQSNLKTISHLEQLTQELKLKEGLALKVGMNNRQELSVIADRLASSLPAYITLSSLDINPVNKKQRSMDVPDLDKNKIVISGELNNSVRLYAWIEILKSFPWILAVEVVNLEQESMDKPAVFTLDIWFDGQKLKQKNQ
jgi:Tfp pilus assembly protein PilN